MANLHEDMVDQTLAGKMMKKKKGDDNCDKDSNDHECEEADEALDEHSQHMAGVMEEADKLKEIVGILEPVQAVEYLAAAKKIRLCVQQWGKKRDHEHI